MATENKQPSPADIAAMLTDRTSACAAREAIAGGACSGVNRSRRPDPKDSPDPAQSRQGRSRRSKAPSPSTTKS
ncbi:hypothetical protein [Streptomyces sp. NPDC059272]|uniref:hypothetical protein n=1 Tax=Streptomyces sp. NPDC059272 TaxID=3346800 RepID=UPI0036BABD5A